jgi:RNA polymerase sigma-70 factor (ECF subfamily)
MPVSTLAPSASSATSSPPSPRSTESSAEAPTGRLPADELKALRSRDPEAVRRHIYGNRDFLRSVLRRFTETEETARDLLQETFFQALRSLPDFRGESKLSTWLYSVAKNVALARYRKDKRRSPLEEETLTRVAARQESRPGRSSGASPSWNPAEETTRNEETALVREALDELSENYRTVIELRDLQQLSTAETAERLGLTRVNVRVRLHRARKKLEEVLDGRFDADYQMA